ncbi:MAG: phosphatidate cytidylyltransferase [Bdellovibrionales bacterium]|nr:phosphatidate cytidylyltransferase [Bdellovibrionales bacterium]
MAESRSALFQRVISAILFAAVVFSLGYFGGELGLYIVCTVAIVLGVREYSRMVFVHYQMPLAVSVVYWAASISFYALMVLFEQYGLMWFALTNVFFFVGVLWSTRNRVSNDNLLPALALGTFGMLYCVLFPNFAVRLVTVDNGPQWFLFLLLVVFFGDTFAYFGGRFLGRHKLMPQLSPNKTIEGCAAGLFGSALAGCIHLYLVMPYVAPLHTLLFCLVCGFAAQSGDLLMSLVKRVAQVKDTGHIMPGHGGVLDRLDGIFIACPLVYSFALHVA